MSDAMGGDFRFAIERMRLGHRVRRVVWREVDAILLAGPDEWNGHWFEWVDGRMWMPSHQDLLANDWDIAR